MISEKNQETWYLYIIRTLNGSLYTGITTNVIRRFNEHSAQGPKCAKSLRGKGPLTLELQQWVGDKTKALKLECKIKKLSKSEKEFLIKHKSLLILELL
jgi:putative endonuclease